MNSPTIETTPVIHASKITFTKPIGEVEIGDDVYSIVEIGFAGLSYLVAGGACNTGLLPSYAMKVEFSTNETLQELFADIAEQETTGCPSGALLAWRGSMVI